MLRRSNFALCAIGVIGQGVLRLLIVGRAIVVGVDRIVDIKDLLIAGPIEVAGFTSVQHVDGVLLIAINLGGGPGGDLSTADFLSSPRIHRTRLSYSSLRIYPVVVDGVAVRCLNGRSERTACHINGCDQLPVELFELDGPIRKIHGNGVQLLAADPADQRQPPGAGFGVDGNRVNGFFINHVGCVQNHPDIIISGQSSVCALRAKVTHVRIFVIQGCSASGNRWIAFIGVVFLRPVDINAVNGHIIHIDIELLRNQVFHGLDAIDVELGIVGRCQRSGGQECQHHGEDQEC